MFFQPNKDISFRKTDISFEVLLALEYVNIKHILHSPRQKTWRVRHALWRNSLYQLSYGGMVAHILHQIVTASRKKPFKSLNFLSVSFTTVICQDFLIYSPSPNTQGFSLGMKAKELCEALPVRI
jgi:hypothetical protein